MSSRPDVSVVVPLFNEAPSLKELHQQLLSALDGSDFEIIFIDDGSTDGSAAVLEEIRAGDPRVGVITFRRNFGKAAALDAGFRRARGARVVTLDADLQDDAQEIPKLLAKLDEGFDLVSGWKRVRRDPWTRRFASAIFNRVVGCFAGPRLHDLGSGFKAYRREAIEGLRLFGELHRFIPVLLHFRGFRCAEVPVTHHPRRHGTTRYGWSRLPKGFFDLLTVMLTTRFRSRPLHLFGSVGLVLGGVGFFVLAYLTCLWFAGRETIGTRPLLFLGLLLVVVGVQLVSTGLVGELVIRACPSDEAPGYSIRHDRTPGTSDDGVE